MFTHWVSPAGSGEANEAQTGETAQVFGEPNSGAVDILFHSPAASILAADLLEKRHLTATAMSQPTKTPLRM